MKKKKISRRKFLTILGVTGGVLVAGGVGGAAYIRSRFTPDTTPGPGEDGEIVTVAEGQLQGTINDGIYRYLGVPYAEAYRDGMRIVQTRYLPEDHGESENG